jgi:hypothetical protein
VPSAGLHPATRAPAWASFGLLFTAHTGERPPPIHGWLPGVQLGQDVPLKGLGLLAGGPAAAVAAALSKCAQRAAGRGRGEGFRALRAHDLRTRSRSTCRSRVGFLGLARAQWRAKGEDVTCAPAARVWPVRPQAAPLAGRLPRALLAGGAGPGPALGWPVHASRSGRAGRGGRGPLVLCQQVGLAWGLAGRGSGRRPACSYQHQLASWRTLSDRADGRTPGA